MANDIGMGLLPYNSQGIVDPYANAMAGGVGVSFGILEQQSRLRDQEQAFLAKLNDYQNSILDNPNKQGARNILGGMQGIQQGQINSGAAKEASDFALSGANAKNEEQMTKTKEEKYKYATNQIMGMEETMKQLQSQGGGRGSSEYWNKTIAPFLKSLKIPVDGDATPDNMRKLSALSIGMQQNMSASQKMAEGFLHNKGILDVAREHSRGASESASISIKAPKEPSFDQLMASIGAKGENASPYEKQLLDAFLQSKSGAIERAVGQRVDVRLTEARVASLKQELLDTNDPKERETLLKTITMAEDMLTGARKKSTLPSNTNEPTPKTQDKVSESFEGKEYPKKQGYHIGRKDGQLGYIKD